MQSDQSGTFLSKRVTPYVAKGATPAVVKGGGVGKRSAGKMVILDTSTSESEAPGPKAKSASSGTKSTTTSAKRSAARSHAPQSPSKAHRFLRNPGVRDFYAKAFKNT